MILKLMVLLSQSRLYWACLIFHVFSLPQMEPTFITDEILLLLGTNAWFKMLLLVGTLSRLGPNYYT